MEKNFLCSDFCPLFLWGSLCSTFYAHKERHCVVSTPAGFFNPPVIVPTQFTLLLLHMWMRAIVFSPLFIVSVGRIGPSPGGPRRRGTVLLIEEFPYTNP